MRFFKRKLLSLLFAVIMILSAFVSVAAAGNPKASSDSSSYRAPYIFSIDEITGGNGGGGSSQIRVFEDYIFPDSGTMTMKGWVATDEGIVSYEYAWVSEYHMSPRWIEASVFEIIPRGDLANAGIPYPAGHSTAGFSLKIKPDENMSDGYYDLYVRAITGDGMACDLALFNHIIYGVPDRDDGDKRIISFPRLEKTPGALQNATAGELGLFMTHDSMVNLGAINLGYFERVIITYAVSQTYSSEKQAILGFKSSPQYTYGNGEEPYNLTDHLTAIPLRTDTTQIQTAELDLTQVDLSMHESLCLSTYLKEDVTLSIYHIELIYSGQGYDRTNAKIYFSEDTTGFFSGINKVGLSGVKDPVMGDVLRMEVIENTNDPFAHFNAHGLLSDYNLHLTADDYKYMVVLARVNPQNTHSSMTFYLCAGSIVSATEACTYSHSLTRDGQWHYYVFDLTDRENWEGGINGWRFDIINGDCLVGNYVDFASIQFFSSLKAAETAAKTSVTQNVTPHALGMPAVVRDDSAQSDILDAPATFDEGDWYVETSPETQAPTEPALPTEPENPASSSPQTELEISSSSETTSVQDNNGCSSIVAATTLTLLFPIVLIIKKKLEDK